MRFIGIEAGGSKFVCALGNEKGEILNRISFQTEAPSTTLEKVLQFITPHHEEKPLDAIGVASFGPLDLNPKSNFFGYITSSPKPNWQYINFIGTLQASFKIPIGFDTDVNAAVLAEYQLGAGKTLHDFLYITVGTGIGCGAIVNGKLLHGALHPEMGHLFIPQDKTQDDFPGICAYHQNCLEGLASGPAIKQRWGVDSILKMPIEHRAWDLEAHYLSLACANYTLTLSPQKIILGGGVMQQQALFPKIRNHLKSLLNQYILHTNLQKNIENYIVPAFLGTDVGIIGALFLAHHGYLESQNKKIKPQEIGEIYHRPWGNFRIVAKEENFQIKILTLFPQGQLSLQKHFKRDEHWVITKGSPTITVNEERKELQVNDFICVPVGAIHRIENFTREIVKIVEVQTGIYLEEDDIIRLADAYGRK